MLNTVPYLYINVIAMCCYALMITAFLAAKKSAEIRSFILLLLGFMLWTGGSVLMRLQIFPGVNFWYYVSLLALFALPLLLYLFVCSFARVKGKFLKIIWCVGTIIILAITPTGVFLAPPDIVSLPNGGIGFTYEMSWLILIPSGFAFIIVLSIIKIFLNVIKTRGIRTPGLSAIIVGGIAIIIGNLIQLIPSNIFPWDTLSGIVFALLLMYSLYSKRMFKLTLLVSRRVVIFISAVICVLLSSYFIVPMEKTIMEVLSVSEDTVSGFVLVIFILMLAVVYTLLTKLIDALFTREEQQSKLIESFSTAVTSSLDMNSVMELLIDTIKKEIAVEKIYICLYEDGEYVARHNSSPLAPASITIRENSSCIKFITENSPCFSIREFESSPAYLSMWAEEKRLFKSLDIECVLSLKNNDEIVGLVLLSGKERHAKYSNSEYSFLSTIGSIAAISVKNASLYEQVYREARIDVLTGVYNYKYFMDRTYEEFKKAGDDCLAVLFVDLDDFKLYNQLYGTHEGDRALKLVADILTQCVGESGIVSRTSGKVFAIILPGYDGRRAEMLAYGIKEKIEKLNSVPERSMYKKLTASCGICVSPHAASNPKELIENADLAAYHAKTSGKGGVVLFKGHDDIPARIAQKAYEIIQSDGEKNPYGESANTIFALTAAIDAKDHYTARHSRNVARYSSILATAIGLPANQIKMVYTAGLLHDIGKISIPEGILNKSGKLTPEEIQIMNGHVNSAIDMIRHLPSMDYLIPAAIGHHERWDGNGYPRGIAGEEIPVLARCLAIADSFDAMTTDRPYRKALDIKIAVEQIEKNAGTQFDPELANVFVALVNANEITVTE